ncbi:sensor histidine kinase [Foetidibacter luteolus]|uniref:sensor histidine kinase n=1 Tax=Foetidibacter luteolus TaxID=2608880 RepID=UPI00129B6D4C|nr:histidine kinase [Foetidibacter luteolus]
MKKNAVLGIVLSAGIAVIGTFPRLIRIDSLAWQQVVISITYTFLFALLSWFLHSYLLHTPSLKKHLPAGGWMGFWSIVCIGLIVYPYDYLFVRLVSLPAQFAEMPYARRHVIVLLRGLVISGLIYFILYYLHMLAEKQKNEIEIEQLKQAQLSANLSSLKEQISPHFLFNTLNTLSTLTQEKEVKEFISQLSNVYRYVLQYKDKNTAMLQEELAFIASYLYIIKARLEDAIHIDIHVSDVAMQSKTPPLTLQILVENAVKHNVAASYKPLSIAVYDTGGYLMVENNFQPKLSVPESTGTGLSNIEQRYGLLFNKEIVIERNEYSFIVKLPLIL